jgi:hypothetical protein
MRPSEFLEEYYEKKKKEAQLPQQEKDINYWKNNCEEDYITTPISVLRYISELEKLVAFPKQEISDEEILKQGNYLFPNIADVFRKDIWEMGAKWYREQLKSKLTS